MQLSRRVIPFMIMVAALPAAADDCSSGTAAFLTTDFFKKEDDEEEKQYMRRLTLIKKRDDLQRSTSEAADCFIRAFGWEVFRRRMSSHDWMTWPDAGDAVMKQRHMDNQFESLIIKARTNPEPSHFDTFESIHFNPSAVTSFNKLAASRSEMKRLGEPQVSGFDQTSIMIKAIWRRVPIEGAKVMSLGIWPGVTKVIKDPMEERSWPSCVIVHHSSKAQPPAGGTCYVTPKGVEVSGPYIPSTSFHTYTIPKTGPSIVFLNSSIRPQAGDEMILVGMHIATKEIPDWTWSTFWFQPGEQTLEDSKARPAALTAHPIWKQFVGKTSVSFNRPVTDRTYNLVNRPVADQTQNLDAEFFRVRPYSVIFNPYLEATYLPNGTMSNCMSCHSRASYSTEKIEGALVADLFGLESLKAFEGVVRTDYSWSLANLTADPPTTLRKSNRNRRTRSYSGASSKSGQQDTRH